MVPRLEFDKDDMKAWMKKDKNLKSKSKKKGRKYKSQKHKKDVAKIECVLVRWGYLSQEYLEELEEANN